MIGERQKVLIGAGIIVFVLILCVVVIINALQKQYGNGQMTTMVSPSPANSSAAQPMLTPVNAPKSWIWEEDPMYAVAYPPEWHSLSLGLEKKEILDIALLPKSQTLDDVFPRLDILIYSAKATSIQERIQAITSLYNKLSTTGYLQQTPISFQQVSATQVQGIIKGSAYIQGNPQHKDVVKTFIIFQKGNTLYVVDDAYYNDETAGENRALLLKILATMNFP